ncbi:MAG: glucose-phosphate adenylyltransferase [Actinomycetota bacterium]|nr:glucose-phosphate adenylyltransferase [Actinomycetota bacterium]MDQ1670882.1 glucose-phosphate adenylyltransferase [Actinomycetota bacterium]
MRTMPERERVLSIVLAGGEGKRLMPLTADRAKPAVPFAGIYRLIDFVLSNLVNGGYRKIVVLTQYKSHSLDRHIASTWRLSAMLGNYIAPVPAQQRLGPRWFAGSADAIYQSLNLIGDERPTHVIVFGADHIYRMDPSQMVRQHIDSGAGVTVAAIRQPIELADQFGVIETANDRRLIAAFREKPTDAQGLADDPSQVYASMGNYVFTTGVLLDALRRDAMDPSSKHDMGGNIIPMLVERGEAQVYDFRDNDVPGSTERDKDYWRDVGTLDAFYDAHTDLIAVHPVFNLYNNDWPIYTAHEPLPPAKFVHAEKGRVGRAINSFVSSGAVVSGASVERSVLSPWVTVHSYAEVTGSVLMNNVTVGRNAVVRNAIVDKNVVIPEGARLGVDADEDRARGFVVSDGGITVVGKGQRVSL